MQFTAARRPAKTYGKANRSLPVHNLFDYNAGRNDVSDVALPNASLTPLSESPTVAASQDTAHTKKAPRSNTEKLPSTTSAVLKGQGGAETMQSTPGDASLFDMDSSEEDPTTDTSGSRASKRRRVVKPLRSVKSHVPAPTVSKTRTPNEVLVGENKNDKKLDDTTKQSGVVKPSKRLPVPKPTESSSQKQNLRPKPPNSRNKPTRTEPHSPKLKVSSPTEVTPDDADVQMTDQTISKTQEYSLDHPQQFPDQTETKSKRIKLSPRDIGARNSSPSQLGLTSLKLDSTTSSAMRLSPDSSSDDSIGQKRIRRRLIDRLDAPSNITISTSEDSKPNASRSKSPPQMQKANRDRQKPSKSQEKASTHTESQSRSTLERSQSSQGSQSRAAWTTKPRTTYASQRSHLSDMVEELDILRAPSSQKSAEEIALKVTASNLASRLELEQEDSEDQTGASRLKSIHELRQAGANKRFDREIDTLLEDINTGKSASKALRLQALVKLIGRLQDPAFLLQFIAGGRPQRLVALTTSTPDLATSTLLLCAFVLLIKSEDATSDILNQMFRATANLAPSMLADRRFLSKLAKDRKENLSKLMIQDLVEFEESFVNAVDPSQAYDHVYPDLLALKCLESSLQKIMQLSEIPAKVTTAMYSGLLELLILQSQALGQDSCNALGLTKVEIALSFLELCSIAIDDADFHIADDQFQRLGDALANVMDKRNHRGDLFEQSVLRVVVSISNNKPRMCNLLGRTAITDGAFQIVNQHFPGLSEQADREQSLDESKLDSIVLALGCLLNFAECDASLRAKFAKSKTNGDSPVTQLVTIFNAQVSKMDEAVTQEQSQVLVAFGYLSMLLCTLSLDRSVRKQVTQLLKNRSFEDVCVAAETFFRHLRTVEAMSGSETSVDNFTARFSAILEAIRESDV